MAAVWIRERNKEATGTQLMFRLGATSYVIEDDLVSNARYLAAHNLHDMELVLFDLDDGRSNLPTCDTVAELNALARAHDLTYTVHLPLDINGAPDPSIPEQSSPGDGPDTRS